ncbi:MAG: hypothetical protein ACJAWL_002958 [Motiliproteus sp.]|jgi:hypothetical protein
MGHYIIDGTRLSDQDKLFEQALIAAHTGKQRPMCACKQPPIEMYLARINSDQVIVKRMPGSGHSHATGCDHYQPPAELSGRGELQSKAIIEDEATGQTTLKLDFSLSKTSITRTMNREGGKSASVIKADPKKLSLLSMIHYLYDEAGLNRWSPRMQGKRNWAVVRYHLLNAASKTTAKKMNLADVLLIPEPFRIEDKAGIATRRRQFISKFKKKGASQPVGIAIGELKALDKARFGFKMTLKHQPDTPLYLADDVHKRIEKNFSSEVALWQQDKTAHVLIAATFTISASGNLTVEAITLMATDANWLPFDDYDERAMIEKLTTERRRFIKGLRYNLSPGDVIATCLLTDTGDIPTALYIDPYNDEENPDYTATLDRVIEDSEYDSVVWRPLLGDVLNLPPVSQPSAWNGIDNNDQ